MWKKERQTEGGRTYFDFTMELDSSYFSQNENTWQPSRSFRVNQLVALDWIVRKCTEYIYSAKNPQSGNGGSGGDEHDDRDVPY